MKPIFFLWIAIVLFSCRTAPIAPATPTPVSFPSALDQARKAMAEGRWAQAWVTLANRTEESAEKDQLQNLVLEAWESAWRKERETPSRRASDWQASLALIRGEVWRPAPITEPKIEDSQPAQWLKGTATVIVNRGLKVENGAAQPDIGIGSGFFISSDGYLLTNHHVIESEVEPGNSSSSRLSVRLPGSKGERLPAKVVGWDRNVDVALLKVEYRPEYVFQWATAVALVPGQRLQALGSPGGLEATLTEGIVSATERPLLAVGEVLQIDAAVNPGNSGGPLLDSSGRVVGIVFAGIRDFQGVNFAIPAPLIQAVLPRLQLGGRAVLPWAGLGLQEDFKGVEVLYVVPRGPAEGAGLQKGDRLVEVAGLAVTEIAKAQVRMLDFGTDAAVPLVIEREGTRRTVWVALEPRPEFPLKDAAMNDLASRVLPLAFGVEVEDLAQGVDRSFRVTKVWPGTTGEELSLAANDPLEVLDWVADTENKVLITRWKVKRRLGGYLESVVQLGASFSSRAFL